jgi:hypothetical protein
LVCHNRGSLYNDAMKFVFTILLKTLLLTGFLSLEAADDYSWELVDGKLVYQKTLPKIDMKGDKKRAKQIEWKLKDGKIQSVDKLTTQKDKEDKKLFIHTPIKPLTATKKLRFSDQPSISEKKIYEEDYYRVLSFNERKDNKRRTLEKFAEQTQTKTKIEEVDTEEQEKEKQAKAVAAQKLSAEALLEKIMVLHDELELERKTIIATKVKRAKDVENYENKLLRYIEMRKQYEKKYVEK